MSGKKSLEEVYNGVKTSEEADKMALFLLRSAEAFVNLSAKLKQLETEQSDTKQTGDEVYPFASG